MSWRMPWSSLFSGVGAPPIRWSESVASPPTHSDILPGGTSSEMSVPMWGRSSQRSFATPSSHALAARQPRGPSAVRQSRCWPAPHTLVFRRTGLCPTAPGPTWPGGFGAAQPHVPLPARPFRHCPQCPQSQEGVIRSASSHLRPRSGGKVLQRLLGLYRRSAGRSCHRRHHRIRPPWAGRR